MNYGGRIIKGVEHIMAAKKSGTLRTAKPSAEKPKRAMPEALKAYAFKPGQSGNPGGRPRKLTAPLEAFLARKDKHGKQYAQLLIESMVMRAIKNSDSMVKEIFERVEGHVPHDPAEAAQFGIKVVVVDIPRPPKMKTIDVGGNGHKPPEDE
jgi:hypothetical protein